MQTAQYLLKDVWDSGDLLQFALKTPGPGNPFRALRSYRRRPLCLLSTLDGVQQGNPGMCLKVAQPQNPMIQIAKFQEVYA